MDDRRMELFHRVSAVTGMVQSELARQLDVSVRTAQRWNIGQGQPSNQDLLTLAELAQARDPGLASELRDEVEASCRKLGVTPPPRPDRPAPVTARPAHLPIPPATIEPTEPVVRDGVRTVTVEAPRSAEMTALLVDAAVAAAADSLQLPPSRVRPALRAALQAAQRGRVTVEEMVKALEPEQS